MVSAELGYVIKPGFKAQATYPACERIDWAVRVTDAKRTVITAKIPYTPRFLCIPKEMVHAKVPPSPGTFSPPPPPLPDVSDGEPEPQEPIVPPEGTADVEMAQHWKAQATYEAAHDQWEASGLDKSARRRQVRERQDEIAAALNEIRARTRYHWVTKQAGAGPTMEELLQIKAKDRDIELSYQGFCPLHGCALSLHGFEHCAQFQKHLRKRECEKARYSKAAEGRTAKSAWTKQQGRQTPGKPSGATAKAPATNVDRSKGK